MPLPRAQLPPTALRRSRGWLQRRLAPPSWLVREEGLGALLSWSCTGALAAAFTLALVSATITGRLSAEPGAAAAWLLVVVLGVPVFFTPFVMSMITYLPLARLASMRTRRAGAIFGASWHLWAHTMVVLSLGGPALSPLMVAPLLVGGLWGSWLPAAVAPPADS